jgi:replicative DNA helicase
MLKTVSNAAPPPLGEDNLVQGHGPGQQLPYNLEAEQGVLGALLADNRIWEKIEDILEAKHFYAPAHQRIFDACATLIQRGQAATPITIKGYFHRDEELQAIGGADYLASLAANLLSVVNAADYAETLHDLFIRRELIGVGQDMVSNAASLTLEQQANDVIEMAEGRLFQLADSGEARTGFVTLKNSINLALEIAEKAYNNKGGISGVTTGLKDLDKQLGGLHNSDLIILAGRPAMGKTALATNIAYNAAYAYARSGGKEGAITAFFSLEMSHDQLTTRILSNEAQIAGDLIRKGQISQDDFSRFAGAANMLSQVPMYIDDTPALTIGAVRTRARRLKREHGLGLIVIDYLQLLRGTGSKQSESNRVVEVSEITRGLKALAKELQVPVLALSQLSRAVEARDDKRPMLSDLRESGSIEQDADIVMFVYREEYYLRDAKRNANETEEKFNQRAEENEKRLKEVANTAEAIVAKQRHGPTGSVRMFFDSQFTRFADLDQNHNY